MLVTQSRAPFGFYLPEHIVNGVPRRAPSFGEADDSRATVTSIGGSADVAEFLQALEQLIHGLLAHAGTLGELARAAAVRARILEHRHVGQTQLSESGVVQTGDDATMD